jgi:hypothetical protein
MGWVVEYVGSWDDGFGSFLDRACTWKVSCPFEKLSCHNQLTIQ